MRSRPPAHLKQPPLPSTQAPAGYARLGATLRAVLVAPSQGFGQVVDLLARPSGDRPPSLGPSVYGLAALGGAGLMSVWLKVASLLELRRFSSAGFRWSYLVAALVLGGVLALVAQWLWGVAGKQALSRLGGNMTGRELRVVWAAAAFPLVLALVPLVPLDLLVVGPEAFATEPLGGAFSTAWGGLSVAIAVTLLAWWLFLLVRGVEAVGAVEVLPAAGVAATGVVGLGAAVAIFRAVGIALQG